MSPQLETGITVSYLRNVVYGVYYVPSFSEIKILPCPRPPPKELIYSEIQEVLQGHKPPRTMGFDLQKLPGIQYLLQVLATLNSDHQFFQPNYEYKEPGLSQFSQEVNAQNLRPKLKEQLKREHAAAKRKEKKLQSAHKPIQFYKDFFEKHVNDQHQREQQEMLKHANDQHQRKQQEMLKLQEKLKKMKLESNKSMRGSSQNESEAHRKMVHSGVDDAQKKS